MIVVLVVLAMSKIIVSQTTLPPRLRPNESSTEPSFNLNQEPSSKIPNDLRNSSSSSTEVLSNSIDNGVVIAELDSASIVDPLKSDEIKTTFKKLPASVPKLYRKQDSRKRKIESKTIVVNSDSSGPWKCPNITSNRNLECGCDMPHTLRCSGDIHSLEVIFYIIELPALS